MGGHVCLPPCERGLGVVDHVTMAGIIGLSVVTGWEKRRPVCVDVAWTAMRVHVGRQRKREGGGDVIDVEGKEVTPPRPPAWKPKARPPTPPPKGTEVQPIPRPCIQAPLRSGRHMSRRGGL